jgi:hypothetical protein
MKWLIVVDEGGWIRDEIQLGYVEGSADSHERGLS